MQAASCASCIRFARLRLSTFCTRVTVPCRRSLLVNRCCRLSASLLSAGNGCPASIFVRTPAPASKTTCRMPSLVAQRMILHACGRGSLWYCGGAGTLRFFPAAARRKFAGIFDLRPPASSLKPHKDFSGGGSNHPAPRSSSSSGVSGSKSMTLVEIEYSVFNRRSEHRTTP